MTIDNPFEFRALDHLLGTADPDCRPLRYGREPIWHSPLPKVIDAVRVPSWSWRHDNSTAEQLRRRVLDANGAFMAPLSGTQLAHGPLVNDWNGATTRPAPGLYQIDAHSWSDPRIVSPLGTGTLPKGRPIWVTHPTLELLAKLTDTGLWPGITVFDAYTARPDEKRKNVPEVCRLADWAAYVREQRARAMGARDAGDPDPYEAVKTGYSVAIQLMLGPKEGDKAKAKIARPDWYHAIRAQHAANQWRKAWAMIGAGIPVLGMEHVDEITIAEDDWDALQTAAAQPKAGFKLDASGLQLGAFKTKKVLEAGEVNRP